MYVMALSVIRALAHATQ
jgi:hypothetical protein